MNSLQLVSSSGVPPLLGKLERAADIQLLLASRSDCWHRRCSAAATDTMMVLHLFRMRLPARTSGVPPHTGILEFEHSAPRRSCHYRRSAAALVTLRRRLRIRVGCGRPAPSFVAPPRIDTSEVDIRPHLASRCDHLVGCFHRMCSAATGSIRSLHHRPRRNAT